MSPPVSHRSGVAWRTIGKLDQTVGVAELDELRDVDVDPTGAALDGLEVGPQPVGADQEVAGRGLGAEAVVGHREVLTGLTALDDGREALDGLARQRERDAGFTTPAAAAVPLGGPGA